MDPRAAAAAAGAVEPTSDDAPSKVQPIAKLGAKFPQASALEAMLMREEAEKAKAVETAKSLATQNAPTKPPPAAVRAPITD
ncbi:MAG: hypothetical protein QM784_24195 [Polyangiaceae bacterium]